LEQVENADRVKPRSHYVSTTSCIARILNLTSPDIS
jgi:hypothetical protein